MQLGNSLFDLSHMVNFAAIDFETANQNMSSICSIGIVIVREGKVIHKIHKLVQPIPNFYNPKYSSEIHGIYSHHTDSQPQFPEVWKDIEPLLKGLPLIAHNSKFDETALKSVHSIYKIPYPGYKFQCTVRASRKTFPKLENYKLPTVCAHLGIYFVNHHNALADAEACARIALKIM